MTTNPKRFTTTTVLLLPTTVDSGLRLRGVLLNPVLAYIDTHADSAQLNDAFVRHLPSWTDN